jgi:hypothetical protein
MSALASSEPSSDLVTLLRSFNPDFLPGQGKHCREVISTVLNWLKVCHITQFTNIIVI